MLYAMNVTQTNSPLRQSIRPLRMAQANRYKTRACRYSVMLGLLEQKDRNQETKVALAVDCCLNTMKERLDGFFAQCKAAVVAKSHLLLDSKKSIQLEAFFNHIVSNQALEQLETEIKHEVQLQLSALFRIRSVNIAAIHPNVLENAQIQKVAKALTEYRRTLLVANTMLKAGNKAWDKSLAQFNFSKPVGKLVKKIELGTVFMQLVHCHPDKQAEICKQQLAKRIAGIIDNIHMCLAGELSKIIAKTFYQLYDDMFAKPITEQRAQLEAKIAQKKSRTISPNPSLYIARQAV